MKKILISLGLLGVMSLQAADSVSVTMKDMRDGLSQVQDGFLYNNKASILDGISKIQKANAIFHDEKSAATVLPQDKKKFSKMDHRFLLGIRSGQVLGLALTTASWISLPLRDSSGVSPEFPCKEVLT